MKWVPTWADGRRWYLVSQDGEVKGRVVVFCHQNGIVDAAAFLDEHDESYFETMKEAAAWLVKKVTNGTGVQ